MPPSRSPVLAYLLSLAVPGLGQLYCGDRPKGWSLLVMALGIGLIAWWSRSSHMTLIMMGIVYLLVAFQTAGDAARLAQGRASTSGTETTWYVIGMLFLAGPFAFPLLWQHQKFSRTAKILWTIAVTLIAVLGLVLLSALGPMLDQLPHY